MADFPAVRTVPRHRPYDVLISSVYFGFHSGTKPSIEKICSLLNVCEDDGVLVKDRCDWDGLDVMKASDPITC